MGNKKGFTLIEVIVSLALIGIIVVAMLGSFDTSLLNITRAGSRTLNTSAAENNILNSPVPVSTNETVSVILPIKSDGSTNTIEISGSYGSGLGNIDNTSYGNTPVEIEAFIPGLEGTTSE